MKYTEILSNNNIGKVYIKINRLNKIKILELMIEDPYISRADLANNVGISETSIYRNIEAMRGKFLRRVGPDKGGFWEIILE